VRRVLLVRHAPTPATRRGAFPADEPLDDAGRAQAAPLAGALARFEQAVCSPARRAVQTACAAGLDARTEPRLAECDFGAWAGRSLADVHAGDPAAAELWMTDPHARPHGGESLIEFSHRVAGWLDDEAVQGDGSLVAITHGGVVKASLVCALSAPPASFWQIAVEPLSITELHAHDRRWTVNRVNCPPEAVR
jgi:broad specificity phosphatase PhoE